MKVHTFFCDVSRKRSEVDTIEFTTGTGRYKIHLHIKFYDEFAKNPEKFVQYARKVRDLTEAEKSTFNK